MLRGAVSSIYPLQSALQRVMAGIEPPNKKKRLSLSLPKRKQLPPTTTSGSRFDTTSHDDLEVFSKKFVPKNTSVALNWAFRIFSHWVDHSQGINGRNYKPEDLWLCRDAESFCEMMSLFCLEVKQKNGNPYTPKSILQILTNLQSYAHSQDSESFPFMNQKDARFKRIHDVVDNVSRQLHEDEVGVSKVQARSVTVAEEQQLWESGVIGTSTPTSLLNAVFYYCGLHLCLRGGDEHRNLKLSQFVIRTVENPTASNESIKCLVYTEHGSKNRPGSMHHVHLSNKEVVHYAKIHLVRDALFPLLNYMCLSCPPKQKRRIHSIVGQSLPSSTTSHVTAMLP